MKIFKITSSKWIGLWVNICAEKEFAEAFLHSQLANNDPQRLTALLTQFAVSHRRFVSSLSLDDIERIATAYLQMDVAKLKI